jgi:hypothetical protein
MKRLIELLEYIRNIFRSYRLSEHDIKVMSSKGYHIFDADVGRFVKE